MWFKNITQKYDEVDSKLVANLQNLLLNGQTADLPTW